MAQHGTPRTGVPPKHNSMLERLLVAGTSACIADAMTFPLDTAKVRLQVSSRAGQVREHSGRSSQIRKHGHSSSQDQSITDLHWTNSISTNCSKILLSF